MFFFAFSVVLGAQTFCFSLLNNCYETSLFLHVFQYFLYVFISVQLSLVIRLYSHISTASNHFRSPANNVRYSHLAVTVQYGRHGETTTFFSLSIENIRNSFPPMCREIFFSILFLLCAKYREIWRRNMEALHPEMN